MKAVTRRALANICAALDTDPQLVRRITIDAGTKQVEIVEKGITPSGNMTFTTTIYPFEGFGA